MELRLSRDTESPQYTSRIEEIIKTHMIIAMPMQKGYPVFFEKGRTFYGKVFSDTGIYSFKSTYADRKMSPLPIWIVTTPFDMEKMQQRSFVRFDVALPIVITYPIESGEEDQVKTLRLSTKDLSGGGLQAISEERIKISTKVKMTLDIPDFGVFELDGQVVRVHQPLEDRKLYWISIKFLGIPNNIRDKIIRFIVRRQLEQRQKGL